MRRDGPRGPRAGGGGQRGAGSFGGHVVQRAPPLSHTPRPRAVRAVLLFPDSPRAKGRAGAALPFPFPPRRAVAVRAVAVRAADRAGAYRGRALPRPLRKQFVRPREHRLQFLTVLGSNIGKPVQAK